MEQPVDNFGKVIFPFLQKTKHKSCYPKKLMSLFIMDTFKGQSNNILKRSCAKKIFQAAIVPQNVTKTFLQISNIFLNKAEVFYFRER